MKNNIILDQVSQLVNQGQIIKSIDALKTQIQSVGHQYTLLCNLGALYMQQGDLQKALQSLNKAIQIDPFAYVAYYNRFLCSFDHKNFINAWNDLQKSLSCLYMVKGHRQKNLKYLNKSIFYCQRNAKAYLYRAKYNQNKNVKLVQNDYEAAIEYCPNLVQIYQQRALYYRKTKKQREFQQNLRIYNSLKSLTKHGINELADNDTANQSQNIDYKEKIRQGVKQLMQLINSFQIKVPSVQIQKKNKPSLDKITFKSTQNQVKQEKIVEIIEKLPLNQNQIHDYEDKDDNLLSSQRDPIAESTKTLVIQKQLIHFRKPSVQKQEKNFRQFFEDQNSGQLNRQIEDIQKQIMAFGGKLSIGQQNNQELDVSDPSNFLTKEIQKTIEDIEKFCQKQMLNDVKSIKSLGSNRSSQKNNNGILTLTQFRKYRNANLLIQELNDLQDDQYKQQAFIQISYNEKKYETSIKRYEWNENIVIPISVDGTELDIKAITKAGVFKASSMIGEGTINMLDHKEKKCLLGNKNRKTAILFYQIRLN